MTRPSKAEHQLISFSREAFGEHLSDLLLCGYGEERRLSSRDFEVQLDGDETQESKLHLIFVAEGPASTLPSLPYGKEPLVLLALLQLLANKGIELNYRCDDLLKLLGWKDTAQTRALIEGAVTKYFHTFYQLHDNSSCEAMKGGQERIRKIRVLVLQAFTSGEGTRPSKSVKDTVVFNIDFVEPMKERKLFGIDWERVKSLTPLTLEFFNL